MIQVLADWWPGLVSLLHIVVGLAAATHVLLKKENVRSAIGWVGLIGLAPLIGSAIYFVAGINRVYRRANVRRVRRIRDSSLASLRVDDTAQLRYELPDRFHSLQGVARLAGELTGWPLLEGNRIQPLQSGDEAYPVMLDAIRKAEQTVSFSSYILDNDRAGAMFKEAFRDAVARGIKVRVLVDSIGSQYTWPPILWQLKREGIPAASFMRTILPWRFQYSNLRSHRKVMVVDGRLGFTGGMNVREGCLLSDPGHHPVQDIHFRVEGPVVAHLQQVFAVDWAFTTGEALVGEDWFPQIKPAEGDILARGIPDGPDENLDHMRLVLQAAIGSAQKRVLIVTPYFLPDPTLIDALRVAALRGLDLQIVVPEINNLKLVQWASMAQFPQLLRHDCKVWLSPKPFDHSKILVVDGRWSFIGSTNWDERSLRLNFEFNLECYGEELAGQLERIAEAKIAKSRRLTLDELQNRSLPTKLRDSIARLGSPYL